MPSNISLADLLAMSAGSGPEQDCGCPPGVCLGADFASEGGNHAGVNFTMPGYGETDEDDAFGAFQADMQAEMNKAVRHTAVSQFGRIIESLTELAKLHGEFLDEVLEDIQA